MAGKRLALLIGNSAYADPDFPALAKPAQDVRDLAQLLRDPQIGGFDDVHELLDCPCYEARIALDRFFKKRAKDDLLLFYFSGHGRREGDLYFICANSEHDALDATAVEAEFVRKQIDRSASQRKVIILDCCHSGAFGKGSKGNAPDRSADLQAALRGEDEGYGSITLTAAKSTETAQEQTPDETLPHSLFTHFLLEGIRTGEADRDDDGSIGAEELFDYTAAQLRGIGAQQTPQKFVAKEHGELTIARNPRWQPPQATLPDWIQDLLQRDNPDARLTGVQRLDTLRFTGDPNLTALIRETLQQIAETDPHYLVRGAARGILEVLTEAQSVVTTVPSPPKPAASSVHKRVAPVVEVTAAKPKKTGQDQQIGQPFRFETVTVDAKGKIIKRAPGEARHQIIDLGQGVTLDMVYVPPGTFWMGATDEEHQILQKQEQWNDHFKSELPRHEVKIESGFWMGKYPVTQAQWQAIMGENPSNFKGANRPVERVSWDNCQEFVRKLNQLTPKESELISPSFFQREGAGGEFRLPSEAEWEYACRAGTTTPFYFGETITTDVANYDGNYTYAGGPKGKYREETTDVGSFPPNAFGLYDMHGNVWEWCADPWHDSYIGAPADGRVWEKDGDDNKRLLRGGSWDYHPWDLRCANRNWYGRDDRYGHIGLRVVASFAVR